MESLTSHCLLFLCYYPVMIQDEAPILPHLFIIHIICHVNFFYMKYFIALLYFLVSGFLLVMGLEFWAAKAFT